MKLSGLNIIFSTIHEKTKQNLVLKVVLVLKSKALYYGDPHSYKALSVILKHDWIHHHPSAVEQSPTSFLH